MKSIRLQRMTGLFTASCLSSVYLPRRFSCFSACMALGASQQGLACRRSSGSRSSGRGRELVKGAWACINLAQASSREGHCELRGSPTRQRGGSSAVLCSSEMEYSKNGGGGACPGDHVLLRDVQKTRPRFWAGVIRSPSSAGIFCRITAQ